jgi:hypothetical protein
MLVELTELQIGVLDACMTEALEQAASAPYSEAVEIVPIFQGIKEALNAARRVKD